MPALTLIQQPESAQMAAFEGYVRQVFPRASFAAWMDWGEWNEDYGRWLWWPTPRSSPTCL